jgi:RimJ/RimL family protein N-acetyltransferase
MPAMPDADPFRTGLPTLDAPRLRLRHPRAADAEALFEIFGCNETLRYWSHEALPDLDAMRDYIARIETFCAERTLFQWIAADRGSDRAVGTVTLAAWDRTHRHAEIGFTLNRAWQGRGLAAEAVAAALRFGFDAMDLRRVEADVDPDNGASLRLLERLGFRREGLLRQRWFTFGAWHDTVWLGLLQEEFVPPAPPQTFGDQKGTR